MGSYCYLKTKYYIIERVGVEYNYRFMTNIGKMPMYGNPLGATEPTFGSFLDAFKFPTYRNATHKLAHWKMPGTFRVMYVDEEEEVQHVTEPVDKECFDERDWQEFHEENGKSR